ncbi:hypothetical protein [Methanobrevibacter sp.]|uniref:hypothetical protein n=1 Tax=Methanobrevibacter sp. TaxID=66852 RepID=UPI00386EE993
MAEGRRIIYDDEDKQIYDRLRASSGIFNNLSITDLFAVALIYGKKEGRRTELGKGATGRVRSETLRNSPVKDLMMVIAVDETGSMDVLSDENEYFRISEEYAKTGIKLLEQDYIEDSDELLNDMEMEMFEFYDDVIANDIAEDSE